jgi:pimeloyl-ACP methyl ester carboxylesterase
VKITRSRVAAGAAVASVVGLAGAAAAGAISVRRWRRGPDPDRDEDFSEPPGTIHRTLAAHDGGELHVVMRGEGRPFFLIHGVTNSVEVWNHQLADLVAAGYRVVAMDARGHGRSRAGTEGHTIEAMGEDAYQVVRALDLRETVAVGHSMGGMILLQMLAAHPELVSDGSISSIALLSTSASPVLGCGVPAAAADLVTALVPLAGRRHSRATLSRVPRGLPAGDLAMLYCRLAFGEHPSPTQVERLRAMTSAVPPEILSQLLATLLHLDLRETLARIKAPALIVVGTRDLLTPVWHARYLANRIPVAELQILPGCGHQIMFERRAQLAAILIDFAERTTPLAAEPSLAAPA